MTGDSLTDVTDMTGDSLTDVTDMTGESLTDVTDMTGDSLTDMTDNKDLTALTKSFHCLLEHLTVPLGIKRVGRLQCAFLLDTDPQ